MIMQIMVCICLFKKQNSVEKILISVKRIRKYLLQILSENYLFRSIHIFIFLGMYVTIPIMQFALLFLSLERLTKHFKLTMTWATIFTKPYLVQVILCGIWIFLVALLVTFMFIKKQFNFSFVKDQVDRIAPPIIGDLVGKVASRRHHCSIDGRLSSVLKTLIIVLFVILIVKPIILSIGFNLLTPFCCKNKRKEREKRGDRRTTKLVTIFLLLNFFFSFPFYLTSMFKSIFTSIDSTKDTFTIILKIVFILRITNIIFECLAFYIFERNSWSLLSKLFYYCTCKKFPIFNQKSDDEVVYTKDPTILAIIHKTDHSNTEEEEEDDDEEIQTTPKKKRSIKKQPEPVTESESDDDDDGAMGKKPKKKSIIEKVETPVESNDETPIIKRKNQSNKKAIETDEDEEDVIEKITNKKRKSQTKKIGSDEDEDEPQKMITTKRKSQIKQQESDEEETKKITTSTTKKKSRTKKPASDDEEHETILTPKRKSRPKVEEEEEEEEFIEKPKTKSRRNDVEIRIPNGISSSHRRSSDTNTRKSTHNDTKRRPTPSPAESEGDAASNASQTSTKMNKPVRKQTTKTRPLSTKQKQTRTNSPNDRHRRESSPSSRPKFKPTTSHSHHSTKKARHGKTHSHTKKPKKDRQTRILEMSDDV